MPWIHNATEREVNPLKLGRKYCVYCRSELSSAIKIAAEHSSKEVRVCSTCGWWWLLETEDWGTGHFMWKGTYANLKELDLANIDQPIAEIRRYLIAKYKKRFDLSWQLYEDVVRSVFKNLGFTVVCYGRQKDGGLDAILSTNGNREIGVQIKKYKNKITVSQIRELVGALVENGITNGAFVTTSMFTRDAIKATMTIRAAGFPIELYDADRFFEILKISRMEHNFPRSKWEDLIESARTVEFDSRGFFGSNEDKERYFRSYCEKKGRKINNLVSKIVSAKAILRHKLYTGKYIYDDILRLFIGVASRSEYPDIMFYFEVEEDARESFTRAVESFLTKFVFVHEMMKFSETDSSQSLQS